MSEQPPVTPTSRAPAGLPKSGPAYMLPSVAVAEAVQKVKQVTGDSLHHTNLVMPRNSVGGAVTEHSSSGLASSIT